MIDVSHMQLSGDCYWIHGNVGEYQFKALIYHDYARIPKSELLGSKISKLSIQYQSSVVFDWERGLDVEAPNCEVQDLIVRLWSELPVLPYKPGDRIRLVAMVDDSDPIEPGFQGTITAVRNMGDWLQIDVQWDSGRSLMLSVPPDRVEVISFQQPGV